jgi:CBS domain containing-hemolysin-like protein
VGNNIVNLFTASYATVVATRFFGSFALGIATGATTLLILIFGEIFPKSFAYTNNEKIARLTAKYIYFFYVVLYPLTFLLLTLNDVLNKRFKGGPNTGVTEEEIMTMARLGVESGAIHYKEHEMIENIFEFHDAKVGDVMTPMYKVKLVNGDVPVDQIAYFVSHSLYSRYPVYEGDTDDIVGYIHVNQIMRALNSDKRDELVKKFMSPVTLVSEDWKVESVFRAMKKDKNHMYLVYRDGDKDDIIGIITMEDILEEIVGEIEDETDKRRMKKRKKS